VDKKPTINDYYIWAHTPEGVMSNTIKVFLKNGEVVEGNLFSIDPVTKSVVVVASNNFRMIMHAQIEKIEGDVNANCAPDVAPSLIRSQSEKKSRENAEKRLLEINKDVTQYAQQVFDEINFVFPAEWRGSTILINKLYAIPVPYEKVQPKAGVSTDKSFQERLEKALEAARRKLSSGRTSR
jgi:hypothetical protein